MADRTEDRPPAPLSPGEFPPTTWSTLRRLQPGDEGYRQRMESLCRKYWGAIHHYAARAWSSGNRDADDLTQEFFVWLLGSEVLARYAPERGSFRHYLKGLLRNFGRNFRRSERRRASHESALAPDAPIADDRSVEAEKDFDRAFIGEATKRALEALKKRLSRGTRATQWQVFEAYDLVAPDARPTYEDLARRHKVPESTVKNYLHRVREKFREQIRIELSETVATHADLEAEWRQLTGRDRETT